MEVHLYHLLTSRFSHVIGDLLDHKVPLLLLFLLHLSLLGLFGLFGLEVAAQYGLSLILVQGGQFLFSKLPKKHEMVHKWSLKLFSISLPQRLDCLLLEK